MKNMDQSIIERTKRWIQEFIVDHHICPFAKSTIDNDLIYFFVAVNENEEECLKEFSGILLECARKTNQELSNAFFILKDQTSDFEDFINWFYMAEMVSEQLDLQEIFQLVPFHPGFIYEGESKDAPGNYTNRSPYPMIHILRVEEVEKAVSEHSDTRAISGRNKAYLEEIGEERLRRNVEFWNDE